MGSFCVKSAGKSLGKLIADSMLGNIAKKLRLFGQDVVYFKNGNDEELLNRYKNRILITGDRELYLKSQKAHRKAILIDSTVNDESEALARIFFLINENPSDAPLRCTLCNGILRPANENERKNVPEKVIKNNLNIYVCTKCKKLYWYGRHWDSIKMLKNSVIERLNMLRAGQSDLIYVKNKSDKI